MWNRIKTFLIRTHWPIMLAMLAAFSSADRVTISGSMTPASIMFSYLPTAALKPTCASALSSTR